MSTTEEAKRQEFDESVWKRYGTAIVPSLVPLLQQEFTLPEENEQNMLPDVDSYDNYDKYLNMEVMIPREGGRSEPGIVVRRSLDEKGNTMGQEGAHPYLDTRVYDVRFQDGSIDKLGANRIAINLFSAIDENGYRHSSVVSINDHQKNEEAVTKDEAFIIGHNGRKHCRITTKGWEIKSTFEDRSTCWVPLVDMKEAVPVDLAHYAKANKIDSEPAFAWWVYT